MMVEMEVPLPERAVAVEEKALLVRMVQALAEEMVALETLG